jgi:acyl dehydratase
MSLEAALAGLEPKIGSETHVGPWLRIDQARVDQFAQATGDFQWIHTDPKRAGEESPYGRTIAHGFLTLSLIPFLTGSVGPEADVPSGMTMAINYGLNKVRFPNAVPVGSKVRARVTLLNVEPAKGGLQMLERVTVDVEGESRPACVAETITLLFF